MVLLIKLTTNASCSETPAPSQPATLLVMMLLVTLTVFQRQEESAVFEHETDPFGKLSTSEPFTCCNRRPPPLPLSAELPRIRLALITVPGPISSLGPMLAANGQKSWAVV